jgi:hypothetical protein
MVLPVQPITETDGQSERAHQEVEGVYCTYYQHDWRDMIGVIGCQSGSLELNLLSRVQSATAVRPRRLPSKLY